MVSPPKIPTARAPLGAWWRLYLVCAAAAVGVLFALWWFTHTFNVPKPNA